MQETLARVLVLLRNAWRYRWPAMVCAWLIALTGWAAIQFIPDRYTATTRIYVDTASLLKPLLQGLAVDRDVVNQTNMVQSVMLSRPNLRKVAEQTGLMRGANAPAQQEAVVDSLLNRIFLGRTAGPGTQGTFEVIFADRDPRVAHQVVSLLLDTFMQDSLGMKQTDSDVAQEFLQTQIAEYERRLVEAENRLAAFKQQNVAAMPGSGGDYYQRLQVEMSSLQALQQRYSQTRTRRDELARQLEGEEPTFGLMGSTDSSPIDGQIARFRAQRDQLLLQYTEKHPQVQALTDTILRLEEEKRGGAKVSSSVAAPGAGLTSQEAVVRSLDMNPVYQNLRMSLSQADADLAEVQGQLRAQQGVVGELRGRVEAIPEVEAELARLNRDYDINRKQYDTLLQRLESARISEQADESSDKVKFRVVEPPEFPVKPSAPPRAQLNVLVLLAALGAGAGLAFVLALLHPTIATRALLEEVADLPVIGSVSSAYALEPPPWYRRQAVLVGGAAALLLVVFVVNQAQPTSLPAMLRNLGV